MLYDMDINKNCELKLFADDAVIYTKGYSSTAISDQLNEQMKRIKE